MASVNLTYRVTGRYMTGPTVTAYHLVGDDGSQVVASKDRIIYMIGKGLVENMRVQASSEGIILRGKGINLNTLPIFDTAKGNFRNNQASQVAASTNVAPKKNSSVSPMGQLRITKRIMYKTNCLGYIVVDLSGAEKKLSRKKVVELAAERLISNAVVQKYTPKGETDYQLILRGVGCDISSLPIIPVDQNGNIIDPSSLSKEEYLYMRAVRMKRGGIIYDNKKNNRLPFESGDYLVCGINGILRTIKSVDANARITLDNSIKSAVCDDCLDNLANYPVEIFGSSARVLNPDQVKKWPIVKVKKAG